MSVGRIDPRAVVDSSAHVSESALIGPYCVIGSDVVIAEGCRLDSHVVVEGPTEIGPDNRIHPMASIGGAPQDLKYGGEPTRLVIGARNKIREYVTLNRGTQGGGGVTRIGDDNLLMAYVHVAHDCQVASRNVFGNAATLGGHVEVGSDAIVSAFSAVHQFCRVANHAYIGGYTVLTQDALPWVTTVGNRAKTFGLNVVGLKRKGYSKETIDALKRCYTILFKSKMKLDAAVARAQAELGDVAEVRYFLDFIRTSERGVCR